MLNAETAASREHRVYRALWAKSYNADFVSKSALLGAFVPLMYYNVQVAQSVTISNEDKKYDFCVAQLT